MSDQLTHSRAKTPSRHNGPSNDTLSKSNAVTLGGFHSSILVIIVAMLLMDTSTSSPLITPLQLASPPPSPSGRNKESWNNKPLITGPKILSISLSGSNLRARSCRNCSISDGVSVFELEDGADSSGAERAERDSRGVISSGGPTSRL